MIGVTIHMPARKPSRFLISPKTTNTTREPDNVQLNNTLPDIEGHPEMPGNSFASFGYKPCLSQKIRPVVWL